MSGLLRLRQGPQGKASLPNRPLLLLRIYVMRFAAVFKQSSAISGFVGSH